MVSECLIVQATHLSVLEHTSSGYVFSHFFRINANKYLIVSFNVESPLIFLCVQHNDLIDLFLTFYFVLGIADK